MATLTCTQSEFHKFIGPKVRNDIQYITKKRKKELGYHCEECGRKVDELEAAHKGMSRKEIINTVLKKYQVPSNPTTYRVNLEKAREEILAAHEPIEEHISMLCRECHMKSHSKL